MKNQSDVMVRSLRRPHIFILAAFLSLSACGDGPDDCKEQDKDDCEDSDSGDDTPVVEAESHYPLLAGASWTYQVVDGNEVELREEIVEAKEDPDAKDEPYVQIILEDNEDDEGEKTVSKIRRIKSGAFRVHKDIVQNGEVQEKVDYDPGFVRFDEAWLKLEEGESKDYGYKRASSLDSDEESRGHRYTLLGKNVKVKVPAGVFTCVHISRERLTGASSGEIVEYWFAKGVGKVRERRVATGKEERLKSFTDPSKAL